MRSRCPLPRQLVLASRPVWVPLGALSVLLSATPAFAATLQVGAGQTYATPCDAINAASPGDEIDIAAGTYHDTCTISKAGLHLKGVGGQPKIDITGVEPAGDKGIYAVEADNVIIENLELMGSAIDSSLGANGAGLRIQSNGVVVTHCNIHDNQNGVLSGPLTAGTGTLTIDHTEFKNNGLGNACDTNSCVHNVYTGNYAKFIFQFNWTHALATDTPDKGHLFKSRALESDVLYNKFTGETGHDSYEVDIPNGGIAIVVGNVIEKGPNPDNEFSLRYGEEGYGHRHEHALPREQHLRERRYERKQPRLRGCRQRRHAGRRAQQSLLRQGYRLDRHALRGQPHGRRPHVRQPEHVRLPSEDGLARHWQGRG